MELEHLGTKELAFHITQFDWDLFWSIHEYELLYHTFGRHHFGKVNQMLFAISHSCYCYYYCFTTGFITVISSINIKRRSTSFEFYPYRLLSNKIISEKFNLLSIKLEMCNRSNQAMFRAKKTFTKSQP